MKRLLATLAVALLAACGGDSATGPTPQTVSIAGTYALKSVGGTAVPAAVTVSGVAFTVTGGTLNMNADLTCAYSLSFSSVGSVGAACTYVRNNDSFVLTGSDGTSVTGSFTNGNTINFVDSGYNLTWQK